MFRRREDSLFDNDTDTKSEVSEFATVVSPGASAAPSAPAASSYAQPMPRPPVAPSQPQSAGAQPASSFRPTPSSPITSDMGRNRMPDVAVKPSIPAASAGMPSPSASVSADKSSKGGARRILTVGNDILLKGEIATCDRLVIEGKVEATLNDVHTVEISEQGSFKGSANIEDAEIRGLFEGDLVVRNRLVIYSTGKVRGKITYGEIEIERGGEMSGEIKTNASASAGSYSSAPRARANKDDKVAA